MKLFMPVLMTLSVMSTAAYAENTRNYKEGSTTQGYSVTGEKIAAYIDDAEVISPGQSIRVYVRPREGCMGSPPVNDGKFSNSRISGILNKISPKTNALVEMITAPVFHDNPMCNHDKYGYYTMDTITEGTQTHKIIGDFKTYYIDVTFGPDSKGKTVIKQMHIN